MRAAARLVTLQRKPWRRAILDDKQLTIGSDAFLPRKWMSAEAAARALFQPATHLRRRLAKCHFYRKCRILLDSGKPPVIAKPIFANSLRLWFL
jgi:hypothetical protein